MSKFIIPYAEVQASNACTLSCNYCTNYSDYNMKGVLEFDEFVSWADSWSKRVKINALGFVGGEPLINPKLLDMIRYSRQHLSDSSVLVTNMTLWNRWPELLDFAADIKNLHLKFSVHQPNAEYVQPAIDSVLSKFDWEYKTTTLSKLLESNTVPKEYYDLFRGTSWPEYHVYQSKSYSAPAHIIEEIDKCFEEYKKNNEYAVYEEKTYINHKYSLTFTISANKSFTKTWQGNSYYNMKPHNNDPVEAHKLCTQTYCPLLFNGRLYKCSSVALLGNVLRDHGLSDDQSWHPYLEYQGIGPEDSDADIASWIENYSKPHGICRMCPTSKDHAIMDHFNSVTSKIKFYNKD
jgi:organic radical activating enzyme